MKKILASTLFVICILGCANQKKEQVPPLIAPFSNVDTLAINDWWNRGNNPIIDLKIDRDSVIAFGIYTVSNNTLKLSAQLYPLYPEESREVRLEIEENGEWKELQRQNVNDLGWSALFRIENWDTSPYLPSS